MPAPPRHELGCSRARPGHRTNPAALTIRSQPATGSGRHTQVSTLSVTRHRRGGMPIGGVLPRTTTRCCQPRVAPWWSVTVKRPGPPSDHRQRGPTGARHREPAHLAAGRSAGGALPFDSAGSQRRPCARSCCCGPAKGRLVVAPGDRSLVGNVALMAARATQQPDGPASGGGLSALGLARPASRSRALRFAPRHYVTTT